MFGNAKSEVKLLKASLAGDTQAFGTVIDKYASLVCAITYSATGNVSESEELAQETFLRAWKGLRQLRDLAKFRPWLCRIARSTGQNWRRNRKRRLADHVVPLEAAAGQASDESGPVEIAMTREQQAVVSQALAQIPENLREPLILFYREQQSTRQVAVQLGLSENAARQRISRARSMLRAQVAAMVETTIAGTKPGKAFKTAVIAALAGAAAHTGTTTAATAVLSLGTKIALAAASIAILAGVAWVHGMRDRSAPGGPAVQSIPQVSPQSQAPAASPAADIATPLEAAPETQTPSAPIAREATNLSPLESAVPTRPISTSEATTAPPEFRAQGVLSGVVTDIETGRPVPNALLEIASGRILHTRTDMHGFYSFDEVHRAGNFDISVDALTHVGIRRGRDDVVVNLTNDKQTVQDFQLPKACMVDVYVVDQNGVGIGAADVVVTSLLDDPPRAMGHFADLRPTDPNGYVLLGGIPPGQIDYLVTAWHKVEVGREKVSGGYRRISKYDYAPGRTVVQLPDPNVIPEVTVVLEDGQGVAGYAEYADGIPAGGVKLSLQPAWWHSGYSGDGLATADDGTFTFEHVSPGTYDVRRHVPHGHGSLVSILMRAELPPADGAPLTVRIPETSPQSQVSISGTITFVGDKRPGYVRIEAYSSTGGHTLRNATMHHDGTATFDIDKLAPGTYTLTFSGQDMEDKTLRNIIAPMSGLVVEMTYAPRPKLSGAVVDAKTGQPITRFSGRVRKLRTLWGPLYVQQDRWIQFDDPEGRFSLDTVGPGIYKVQIQADGYAPPWSEPINTDEGTRVQVALAPGGAISGMVVDEQGQAIAGAKITPLSKASGAAPETKDAFASEQGAAETVDGRFVLKNLPPGVETLKATHPDYTFSMIENVPVHEGATTPGVEIVLSQGATVEGRVYDGQGRPQPGRTLLFNNAHGYGDSNFDNVWRLASVVTDANGFYRVTHLPEDVCYVKRTDTWRTLGVVRRAVVPRADHVTQLDFGGTPVIAGVVVVNGVPQTKTKLRLVPAEATHVRTFTSFAMTDEQGAFVFNGVAPGTHAIYYQHRGKRQAWLKIATMAVADNDLDLGIIPRSTSTLAVTLDNSESDSAWTIQSLFLAERDSVWPVPVRLGEPPAKPGNPWLIHDVAPGQYRVILERTDGIQWRHEASLDAGLSRWELILPLPSSTAQVRGRLASAGDNILTFWRQERTLFSTLSPGSDGSFAIADLPPGRYGIGSARSLTYRVPPFFEFELQGGEHRTIDLDLKTLPASQQGFVNIQVLDEAGAARRDARLWLEGPAGPVEPLQFTAAGHAFVADPGRHSLHVELPGYHSIEKEVVIEAGSLLSKSAPACLPVALKRR